MFDHGGMPILRQREASYVPQLNLGRSPIISFIDLYRSAIVTDVEAVIYQVRGIKSAVLLISTVSPDC